MKLNLRVTAVLLMVFTFTIAQSQNNNIRAQFSVFPGLSTNGDSAKTLTNNLSFNLFAGHQGGLNGFELSVAANILEHNAQGMQVSGITNIVKQDVRALQVAGITNIVGGDVQSLQVAGITNLNKGSTQGLQAAGIFNYSKTVYGAQVSGITARTEKVYGLQVNGIVGSLDTLVGLQVSGVVSQSGVVTGAQISGFVNIASELQGVQIGFINISDDVKGGVPIGFASFVRNGYKTIDVSYNEIFPATLALKTGVDPFYNIFSASSNFQSDEHLWTVGYGLGSRLTLTETLLLEFEVTASHLSQNQFTEELNALSRFNFNLAVKLGKVGEIYFGPSLNLYATQVYNSDTQTFGYDIAPGNSFYKEVIYDLDKPTYLEAWIGGQIGIRL